MQQYVQGGLAQVCSLRSSLLQYIHHNFQGVLDFLVGERTRSYRGLWMKLGVQGFLGFQVFLFFN